ncbi:RNA-binding protein [Martelella alba]|uniref:RNA-binding protein n=1 Tax=Martelella alba TaxID=2590451 RepID=A0A506UGG6_9HYPH|nr:RNA-binding protein [Martelella alba]TPW32435.1 RNA-binding protein [Martelella alba]
MESARDEEAEMNERTCIVTRQTGTPDDLIRFVAGPGDVVFPDLKRELPGRGCWVTAERWAVAQAVEKKLFARALKAKVTAEPELADMVDGLLARQLAGMIHMARKAGEFVTGSTKVDLAIRSGQAIAVFHAEDAADDGVRKLDQARKAFMLANELDTEIPAFRPFGTEELIALLGENAFKHAAALAGKAGEGVVKRANMLVRFRAGGPSAKR